MPRSCRLSTWTCYAFGGISVFMMLAERTDAAELSSAAVVEQVINDSGIDRGICAVLGFDDEAALKLVHSGDFLIHVRDPNAETIARLREVAAKAKLGIDRVVVEQGSLDKLPYADNTVDLLLATKITDSDLAKLSAEEVLRVLRPLGVAVVGKASTEGLSNEFVDKLAVWASRNREVTRVHKDIGHPKETGARGCRRVDALGARPGQQSGILRRCHQSALHDAIHGRTVLHRHAVNHHGCRRSYLRRHWPYRSPSARVGHGQSTDRA